jgi:hypothetical protein
MMQPRPQTDDLSWFQQQLPEFTRRTCQEARRRRWDKYLWWLETSLSEEWVNQGVKLQDAFLGAPQDILPELFALGEALEKLPRLEGRRNLHRKANRMTFELQEALFVTFTRLLARRTPQELVFLDEPQRAYLRRAVFRSADAGFVACALLVLATLRDTNLRPQAQELLDRHPSERIREAASEYISALAPS